MFISAILIVFKFLFRCSYFNRSWPADFRDGRFLIAFTTSCIANGSVDGSDWGCEGSISFGQRSFLCEFALEFGFAFALKIFL